MFVAFKALPIDPARSRRGTGSFEETAGDDLAGARSCREAVEVMVEAIRRACVDIGGGGGSTISAGEGGKDGEFVKEVDIVRYVSLPQLFFHFVIFLNIFSFLVWQNRNG